MPCQHRAPLFTDRPSKGQTFVEEINGKSQECETHSCFFSDPVILMLLPNQTSSEGYQLRCSGVFVMFTCSRVLILGPHRYESQLRTEKVLSQN